MGISLVNGYLMSLIWVIVFLIVFIKTIKQNREKGE